MHYSFEKVSQIFCCKFKSKTFTIMELIVFFPSRHWFVRKPDGWIWSQGSVQHAVGKHYPILSQPLREPSGWASGQTPVSSSDRQPETPAPRPESQQIRRYGRCEMMWKACGWKVHSLSLDMITADLLLLKGHLVLFGCLMLNACT